MALSSGNPILLMFAVFPSSYEKVKAAPFRHPLFLEGEPIRNHAVLIVGFDDQLEIFTILDSQGKLFADNGFWYLDFDTARSSKFTVLPPVAIRQIRLKRR